MKDIIAINRQFLIMARDAANYDSGEMITGIPRPVLDMLTNLSLDQIEMIAKSVGISLITFRLSKEELDRMIKLRDSQRAAYSLAVITTKTC